MGKRKNRPSQKKRKPFHGFTAPVTEQQQQYLVDKPNPDYQKRWTTPEPAEGSAAAAQSASEPAAEGEVEPASTAPDDIVVPPVSSLDAVQPVAERGEIQVGIDSASDNDDNFMSLFDDEPAPEHEQGQHVDTLAEAIPADDLPADGLPSDDIPADNHQPLEDDATGDGAPDFQDPESKRDSRKEEYDDDDEDFDEQLEPAARARSSEPDLQ